MADKITNRNVGDIINFKKVVFMTLENISRELSYAFVDGENLPYPPKAFYEYSLPRPKAELPAVTFRIENQDISQELDGDWQLQQCRVVVDFWADKSREVGIISRAYIAELINRGWRLETTTPVPNPDSDIFHINAVFMGRVGANLKTDDVLDSLYKRQH